MDPLSFKPSRPAAGSYPEYYEGYFKWTDLELPIMEVLLHAMQDALEFWNSISEQESQFAYADGKWSLREMLSHITDTERVFVYRALCISRGEQKVLPGFDHDAFVENSGANERSWASILQEYQQVKQASLDFFAGLNELQWTKQGSTEAGPISVAALAYVLPGHDRHHQEIVKTLYLPKLRKA